MYNRITITVIVIDPCLDQRRRIFWCSLRVSENLVLRTLLYLSRSNFVATVIKYGFDNNKKFDMLYDEVLAIL